MCGMWQVVSAALNNSSDSHRDMAEFTVCTQDLFKTYILTQSQLYDYLDIEATVDNEEEETFSEEEELGESVRIQGTTSSQHTENFFDDDDEDSTSEWITHLNSPAPSDFSQEIFDLRARFARPRTTPVSDREEVQGLYLIPTEYDPHMWSVRVKVSLIASLLYKI